ncbi:MAG: hypothetical protein NTY68_05270 [Candidatus Micrarchaeota archaeon]|nr:hypothetical protein [Candidatus Micrarchaeota archaeon]
MPKIAWNNNLKLVISDVDETIAGLYTDASPGMVHELESILNKGISIFLVSGQGVSNIHSRITSHIKPRLRNRVAIGHCSGAEVWGFDKEGNLLDKPFYSMYDMPDSMKKEWRKATAQLVSEFSLRAFPVMPIPDFMKISKEDPFAIMLEDRGPQITFEVVNGHDIPGPKARELEEKVPGISKTKDLRVHIARRAEELFSSKGIPVTPRLAGVFAIDFAIKGISKATAVRYVTDHSDSIFGIPKESLNEISMEVWGDKFSLRKGGTDSHILEALPKGVRAITFRKENPSEFPSGCNIAVWDGKKHLHEGLLEFLKASH